MPLWSLYRQSVRTQLLWLLGAAMLPLLGLLFRQIYLERLEARERANDQVRILAQQTAQNLNLVLRDYEAVLQRIGLRPSVRALDARACDPLIAEFVRLYPGFTNLVVQDLKGGNDCSFLDSKITPEQLALVPGYVQARTAEGMTVGGGLGGAFVRSMGGGLVPSGAQCAGGGGGTHEPVDRFGGSWRALAGRRTQQCPGGGV